MGSERNTSKSGFYPVTPEGVMQEGGYTSFSRIELLDRGIRTERMELIPVGLIITGESIVDESHVSNLAESMRGDRGQITPITVRARLGRLTGHSVVYFEIVDGFHRAEGMSRNGTKEAKAVVIYGCNDEELSDLRVLAANSVKSVQFARVARWMQDSFKQSPWGNKGITLSQALSIAVFDSSGVRLGLTKEEATEIKEWAHWKAKTWGKSLASVYTDMMLIERAAPDLVAKVRVGGGGSHSRAGELSPARLKAVVEALPDDHNLQQQVIEVVLSKNLVSSKARLLAKAVAELEDNPENIKLALEDPSMTIEIMQEKLGLLGRKTAPEEDEWEETVTDLARPNKGVLIEPVVDGGAFFWRHFPELTDNERQALTLVFDECLDFREVADRLGILSHQLLALLISGIRRYQIVKRGTWAVESEGLG